MTDQKPPAQGVTVGGIDAHQAMGEQPKDLFDAVAEANPNPIPQFVIDEGIRQAEGGAHFYGKKLSDCTREELYGAIVAAWFEVQLMREGAREQRQADPT